MANNYENFDFNQNDIFTGDFFGFQEGSADHEITPCPIVTQNNESQNALFMSSSLKNQGFYTRFNDLTTTPFHKDQNASFMGGSHRIFTGIEDFTINHPPVQQNNVGRNNKHMEDASITFTCPPSEQNNAPYMTSYMGIFGGTNHNGSTYDSLSNHGNTVNTSRNLSRSAYKVNQSPSVTQCKKQVRFRFDLWTNEEKRIMDEELIKCTFLPGFKICRRIAIFLPNKSIRDIGMRIQCLMKQGKLDNVWDRVETSPEGDLSELSFYVPDNPNDPDLLAIRNKLSPRAVKRIKI